MIRDILPVGTRINVDNLEGYRMIEEVIAPEWSESRFYMVEGYDLPLKETRILDVIERSPLMIIIGRTASGKDTLAERYVGPYRSMAKSYTTRPRREGEGDTHKFIDSVVGYDERWAESEIGGYEYFLTPEDVEKHNLLILDPIGFQSLIDNFEREGVDRELLVYYIMADEDVRKKRYMNRDGSSAEEFYERDKAEDEQFTEFESRLQDKEFLEQYDINVRYSETGPRGHAMYSIMKWVRTPYHPEQSGMWKIRQDDGTYTESEFIDKRKGDAQ